MSVSCGFRAIILGTLSNDGSAVWLRKRRIATLIAALGLQACSSYDPLTDGRLRQQIGNSLDERPAVKVTFLGNSTLVLEDGRTTLLVDGFLSRPGIIKTVLGGLRPSAEVIHAELAAAGVHRVNAVLVGHAHHDHALDATAIADLFGAEVYGSASYAKIYEGSHITGSQSSLITIPRSGRTYTVGDFSIEFVPSSHVAPESLIQRLIEGEIETPLEMPAHFTRFKCGDVFALHIRHKEHPKGDIVVTTTAGARPDKLLGHKAAVLFLSVGYLSKERPRPERPDSYWEHTVTATNPDVIVPVHWDKFTKKLSAGLAPATGLAGDTQWAMEWIKGKAGRRKVRVLDLRESLWISDGDVYCPAPQVK